MMCFDHKPYFHMTLEACRRAGAMGGRRSALKRRERQLAQPPVRASRDLEPQPETAHQASVLLDQQFPHLRDAWRPSR